MANSPLRMTLVSLFFALMFVCSIASAILLLGTSYTSSYSGFVYKTEDYRVIVSQGGAPEVASTLRVRDQILEFNGKQVTGSAVLRDFFVLADAGSSYDL